MQSGTVTDIAGVVANCRAALRDAEEMAGFRPTRCVIGMAGELVKGFTTSHSQERRRPDQPITEGELQKLMEGVQREALYEAERAITWETGLPTVDVRLVHAAVTGASIDGYPVTNPIGFRGRHVRISIFNAFAPLIHLGALQSVASQLGPGAAGHRGGAVRRGTLHGRRGDRRLRGAVHRRGWRHHGRRARTLGRRRGDADVRARRPCVHQVARGSPGGARSAAPRSSRWSTHGVRSSPEREQIGAIVAEDVAVWQAGVELVLEEFGKHGQLPARLELCGGGSRLPELRAALTDPEFARQLPFVRPPVVEIITPAQVMAITDTTDLLVDQQDVTPMALAYQAIEMSQKEEPLDAALRRVLRVMRV